SRRRHLRIAVAGTGEPAAAPGWRLVGSALPSVNARGLGPAGTGAMGGHYGRISGRRRRRFGAWVSIRTAAVRPASRAGERVGAGAAATGGAVGQPAPCARADRPAGGDRQAARATGTRRGGGRPRNDRRGSRRPALGDRLREARARDSEQLATP